MKAGLKEHVCWKTHLLNDIVSSCEAHLKMSLPHLQYPQHIGDTHQCNWIRERVEHPDFLAADKEKKVHLFERLCFADTFESFLAHKFNTSKRFGLDGGESIVPAMKDAIDRASELGAHSFIIGMPHRGRLNILANVMRKPMTTIFSEFQGTHYDEKQHTKRAGDWGSAGDVKVCLYC